MLVKIGGLTHYFPRTTLKDRSPYCMAPILYNPPPHTHTFPLSSSQINFILYEKRYTTDFISFEIYYVDETQNFIKIDSF